MTHAAGLRPEDARVLLENSLRLLYGAMDDLRHEGHRVPVNLYHAEDFARRALATLKPRLRRYSCTPVTRHGLHRGDRRVTVPAGSPAEARDAVRSWPSFMSGCVRVREVSA